MLPSLCFAPIPSLLPKLYICACARLCVCGYLFIESIDLIGVIFSMKSVAEKVLEAYIFCSEEL